jgi:hypothetical protein
LIYLLIYQQELQLPPRYKIDIAALKKCSADIQLPRYIILNKLWLCIVRLF